MLRHELHQHPELSGQESNTAKCIVDYLKKYQPDTIIPRLGKHGVAATFNGNENGPTTLVRCELDALPIVEVNDDLQYKSIAPGISHKCGHDGHMAIICGLARLLYENPPIQGKVVLLFQSAEETGQGARWILEDEKFQEIKPNYVFALHNLPGYPTHQILLKKDTFCAASQGVKIKLTGITSHASEPEKGLSPAIAVSQLIPELLGLPTTYQNEFEDFVLVTLTHTEIGEKTFGVSPANAEIYLTIRAYLDHDLKKLTEMIRASVEASTTDLSIQISIHEAFDATVNHEGAVNLLNEVALEANLNITDLDTPNRWSEDFGLFLQQSNGAIFGLGSGMNQPALHNPDYDFPDQLIETGIRMFWKTIQKLNYS